MSFLLRLDARLLHDAGPLGRLRRDMLAELGARHVQHVRAFELEALLRLGRIDDGTDLGLQPL